MQTVTACLVNRGTLIFFLTSKRTFTTMSDGGRMTMTDTKERIMQTALDMFSCRGYEAVSVSDIAGELGITKGALYRHYKSKREIFDHIIAHMETEDLRRAREFEMPENRLSDSEAGYDSVTVEQLGEFTRAQFIYWTQDEFAAAFRRILLLERYNDEGIERLYNMYLGSGPLEYVRDVLSFALPGENAELLAVKYYAPMYFLMELEDSNEALKLLERHIEDFERKLL